MKASPKLAILVPDGAYPLILRALVTARRASLGIRQVELEIIKDAFRDSSGEAVELLRPYKASCSHALLVRDLHGSGWEDRGAMRLESHLRAELAASGWATERCDALVVEPEVEAWLRFDSPHLQKLIKERARRRKSETELLFRDVVQDSVANHGGGVNSIGKPHQPKEVFEDLLFHFGIQRSNALYENLAAAEGLKGCKVASFQRLVSLLKNWFPAV